MGARTTPLMQQFYAAKQSYPDSILFFRMGDFYEMFEQDAVLAAQLLELTLTSRNKGKPDEVPMAGVPHHAAHGYIARLLELGHQVAVCEQMVDPSTVKGIVPREVVRVLTPGTVTDRDQLDAKCNNWLAAIDVSGEAVGIALLDLSTAELLAAQVSDLTRLLGELMRSAPRELVLGVQGVAAPGASEQEQLGLAEAAVREVLPQVPLRTDSPLGPEEPGEVLAGLAGDASLLGEAAARAAARALRFARQCNPLAQLPVRRVGSWDPQQHLVIDPTAQRHLELVQTLSGERKNTLLSVVDLSRTPVGARLLRRRLLAPLLDVEAVRRRLDEVELFVTQSALRADLLSRLGEVGDLERLTTRAELREASPRDLGALRDGLLAAEGVVELLSAQPEHARETLGLVESPMNGLTDLLAELRRALVERPPALAKDGSIFLGEYDRTLEKYDILRKQGTSAIVLLEESLRRDFSLPKLKVRYTRVFGWYVEVGKSQLGKVPEGWRRKQTVAAGERYTLPELDELAEEIAQAEERHRERELELLKQLVDQVVQVGVELKRLSAVIARLDVAASLAELAHRYDYCRPEIYDDQILELKDARHPVVERLAAAGRFVPNDVRLDASAERLWIITGPNMAGKSTLLRQVALITVLAQMGSYVPAKSARIGLVDRVLSRVGASDNLARGESTFMVEMRETAEILRSASQRSLVILDEIGRGTSTFDGLAIAWAVAEYLNDSIGCRALFATHYHELTELGEGNSHIANYSVSARELDGDIVFLHRLVSGAASRSYGVAVAKLAGLPEVVLSRARGLLEELESGRQGEAPGGSHGAAAEGGAQPGLRAKGGRRNQSQLDLFAIQEQRPKGFEVLELLRHLELERLSPLDAHQLLARLKKKL